MKNLKLKTHKGIKKVLNARPGGTISIGRPGSRHNTGKKSRNINRKNRKGSVLNKTDKKRLSTVIY